MAERKPETTDPSTGKSLKFMFLKGKLDLRLPKQTLVFHLLHVSSESRSHDLYSCQLPRNLLLMVLNLLAIISHWCVIA